MKKILVILMLFTMAIIANARPKTSSVNGIIEDMGVRREIINLAPTRKVKFISGKKLVSFGPSKGRIKGEVWGQYIKLKIKNPYGEWVTNEFELYVVEQYGGKVVFAGLRD